MNKVNVLEISTLSTFKINKLTDLLIILNGALSAQRYVNKIPRPCMVPYAVVIGDSLMQITDRLYAA